MMVSIKKKHDIDKNSDRSWYRRIDTKSGSIDSVIDTIEIDNNRFFSTRNRFSTKEVTEISIPNVDPSVLESTNRLVAPCASSIIRITRNGQAANISHNEASRDNPRLSAKWWMEVISIPLRKLSDKSAIATSFRSSSATALS